MRTLPTRLVFLLVLLSCIATQFALAQPAAPGECNSDTPPACHALAWCVDGTPDYCECQIGTVDSSASGDGTLCSENSWAVRYVIKANDGGVLDIDFGNINSYTLDQFKGNLCSGSATVKGYFARNIYWPSEGGSGALPWLEVRCLYETEALATSDLPWYQQPVDQLYWADWVYAGPTVQPFTLPTTSAPIPVPPTGLTIDSVAFDTSCAASGCWVIEGTMTTGGSLDDNNVRNNVFNTFFLPYAEGNHTLSYDFDYTTGGNSDSGGSDWTFEPVTHPCTSADFDASMSNTQKVTTCCITNPTVGPTGGFLANYRTTVAFESWASGGLASCLGTDGQIIQRIGYEVDGIEATDWTVPFPSDPLSFLEPGKFDGMTVSPGVTELTLEDPFIRQFTFRIELDEVELRTKAGQLTGTVGVEHTVDTFLGLSSFRTTGLVALDTFATQAKIHLEKTSFFSASTHGVNEYTFLEYVNMRLVAIYKEDDDFSGDTEQTSDFIRTSSSQAAHYVQVTFTLGDKYEANNLADADGNVAGLIPTDSVRVGQGTFINDDTTMMNHACSQWDDNSFADKGTFVTRLGQGCAPSSTMCSNPGSIPDSFVAYNIPIGIDAFDAAEPDLSANVFVSLVVNAIDTDARDAGGADPNDGGPPWQMKTTLTASIPIVVGGINIFCDGLTGKTDLVDVANVDIVVGSAQDEFELTRLRILEDIASTSLTPQSAPTEINSDSIEAGLMTLVIKGESSYFQTNSGRQSVTLELEDVITIHIMESDGDLSETAGSMVKQVMDKITADGDDNDDASGLDTNGYNLNGAFKFTVDRGNQRAYLEPRDELLGICPFNPPRPTGGSPLTTCVTRRDVRYRGYPNRQGAFSTAMEICTEADGACTTNDVDSHESMFFASILGNNEYSKKLAVAYAQTIATAYTLNGRYRRAYWINPGYEWTPTQTGGRSIFSISQKIFLFALITMDEGLANAGTPPVGSEQAPTLPDVRRRMLLQSTPADALKEGQTGVGSELIGFQTSPTSMMAKAFDVTEDRVATFDVKMQLTQTEACMSETQLLSALQATLEDYVEGASTPVHTVQITRMEVDRADVACTRRAMRGLKSSFSAATADVTVLTVFKADQNAEVSFEKILAMAGIQSITENNVSPKVDTTVPADKENLGQEEEEESGSSSSNTALIAGIAGGVGAALVLVIAAVVFMKSKKQAEPVMAVQTINVQDLKSQLAGEV